MELEDAIKHAEEKSGSCECGKEHAQLAKWLKELALLKASHASAPEGFKHDIGADRFTVVQGSYWWHVRAGEGTQNIGKFHTKRAAEELALTLITAFRDGAFMQYQTMLAASPTQPVSEDRKDAEIERLNSLVESVRSNNEALHHARDLLRSEVNKQSAALKLAREALQGIHPGNMTPMAEKNWMEALAAIEALKGEVE